MQTRKKVALIALVGVVVGVWTFVRAPDLCSQQPPKPGTAAFAMTGAGYVGDKDANTVTPADIVAQLKAHMDGKFAALEAKVDALGSPQQAQAQGGQPRDPVHQALDSCVACHTQGTEKGKFAMFDKDGNVLQLTVPQLRNVVGRVTSARPSIVMPPPEKGKLPEEQVAALVKDVEGEIAARSN
jgi:hypothetical protein